MSSEPSYTRTDAVILRAIACHLFYRGSMPGKYHGWKLATPAAHPPNWMRRLREPERSVAAGIATWRSLRGPAYRQCRVGHGMQHLCLVSTEAAQSASTMRFATARSHRISAQVEDWKGAGSCVRELGSMPSLLFGREYRNVDIGRQPWASGISG